MLISKDVRDYLVEHLSEKLAICTTLREGGSLYDEAEAIASERAAFWTRAIAEVKACAGKVVEVGKSYRYVSPTDLSVTIYTVTALEIVERWYAVRCSDGTETAIQLGSPMNLGSVEVTDSEDLRLAGIVKYSPPGVPFTQVDRGSDGSMCITIPDDAEVYMIPKWQRFIPHVVIDAHHPANIGDVVQFTARAKHFGIEDRIPIKALMVSNTRTFRRARRSYVRQVELIGLPRRWFDISQFETYAEHKATLQYRDHPNGPTIPAWGRS